MSKCIGRLLAAVLTACALCSSAAGEAREGVVKGTFVKLAEQRIGEREYLTIVVKAQESGETITLIVPKRPETLVPAARKLTEGQKVAVPFVMEEGQRWVKRIEAEGVEARDAEADSPEARIKQLLARIAALEKELRGLREENARLRRQLGQKEEAGGEGASKPPEAKAQAETAEGQSALPEGLRGFRGMMAGTLVSKEASSFVLKVKRIVKVWERNEAREPEVAVGKELRIHIRPDFGLGSKFMETLRGLEVGDAVVVECFAQEGRLVVVETLRKAE